MSFARRLLLYGIGFSIGCVAVYLMLVRDRVFPDWSPKGRVREAIFTKKWALGEGMNSADTVNYRGRVNNAKVDFARSTVRGSQCKTYVLVDEMGEMAFALCDTMVMVVKNH